MAKKVWKTWKLRLAGANVYREENGELRICWPVGASGVHFPPKETRRLFQKLSGDYKD